MNLWDKFLIWCAKQATCTNSSCPVPISVRRKKSTLYEIAGDIGASTFDVIDPTFLYDKGVQSKFKQEHCLKNVRQMRGWQGAEYNSRTGNIERF